MKKVYIARHAKSSWKIGTDDFDRTLKKRGKLNAPFMAQKLVSRGASIEKIISSSAKRTTKTSQLMAKEIDFPFDQIEFDKSLYLASPKTIVNRIKAVDDSVNEILIVAHNPGVTQVVNYLAKEHFENIPTAGVACILFDVESWGEIKNNGKLGFYIYPKMFKQTENL